MEKIDTHKVALKFFKFECSPEELTNKLELGPTETALKGQEYFTGPNHNRIKTIWSWNFWMYQEVIEKKNHWIGDQIGAFIDNIIKPRQEKIKEIITKCDSEFSIVQYIYDGCNPGLHFDNTKLKILSDIGVEIDIDIYVLCNGQEGKKENQPLP